MISRSAPIALAALITLLAGADRALGSGTGTPAPSPAAIPATGPIPVDSLEVADLKRCKLYGPDIATLVQARREIEYAINQFRRYIGDTPPKLTIAVLGTMSDPSRVSAASMREASVDYVVTDWPARPGAATPATPAPTLSERAGRWELLAFEKLNAKASPPSGKTRLVTDWFDVGLGGLCAAPAEQNRRLDFMNQHLDQRIPIEKLLAMSRPERGAPAGARSKGKSAAPAVDPQELFDAEALSFSRFIAAKEGDRFVGWVLEPMLAGQPAAVGFNRAKTLFARPDQLESAWLDWIKGGMKVVSPPGTQPMSPD
jgi:hypothetical protein